MKQENALSTNDYKKFIKNIKKDIIKSRNNALKTVNKELISLYWKIGKQIYEKQQKSQWGDNVIGIISKDLETEFGKGFSKRNIFRMLKLYNLYKENQKVATVLPQISWSHHGIILDKCNTGDDKDYLRREFYIKTTILEKWSVRELSHNIEFKVFEKWTLKQTNFQCNLPNKLQKDVSILVKDAYDFSFLGLEEPSIGN